MDEHEKKPLLTPFADTMTKGQRIAVWIYLPLHIVIIPLLLNLLIAVWPDGGLTDTGLNVFYYGVGTVYMFVFLWGYFRRAFDTLLDNLRGVLSALALAYLLDLVLSWAFQLAFMAFGGDLTSPPNNDAVMNLAGKNYNAVFALSVFLAPLVEEPLFRGAVFGGIHKTNRYAAYAVSALLFALYHVWQYVALTGDLTYLLYSLSYIPVSVALAFAYERSGSIWTPIIFHMGINALSMSILGGG
ncbi:MAG: CPBP family intramembrane glutamic endopeptidase [Oscillospiraceae bacterium]